MKRTWTIIGVGDVPGSFKWYQTVFGQPATLPAQITVVRRNLSEHRVHFRFCHNLC
jgi:hypothetical protein